MKKIILFLLFLITLTTAKSQDTIFYNNKWKVVNNINEAKYYRLMHFSDSVGLFLFTDYYINGQLQSHGSFKSTNPDVKEGPIVYFYENGNIMLRGTYKNNKKEGLFEYWDSLGIKTAEKSYHLNSYLGVSKYYYPNGNLKSTYEFINNDSLKNCVIIQEWYENGQLKNLYTRINKELDGKALSYYSNGNKLREDFYKNDKLVNGACYSIDGSDTTYFPFFEMPIFKKKKSFRTYISKKLVFPEKAFEDWQEGTVSVGFYIDEKGNLVDAYIEKSNNEIFNKYALKVVESSPRWRSPGKINGIPVRFHMTFPINFCIDN